MDEPTHLHIGASAVNGGVVITLAGELDLASGPDLAAAMDDATAAAAEVVIVDLRGLEFMDSTGIRFSAKPIRLPRNPGTASPLSRAHPKSTAS